MKNLKFIEIYKSLPRVNKIRTKKRDQIIEDCQITKSIFYNWLSGITPIDENSKPIIAKLLKIDKLD